MLKRLLQPLLEQKRLFTNTIGYALTHLLTNLLTDNLLVAPFFVFNRSQTFVDLVDVMNTRKGEKKEKVKM